MPATCVLFYSDGYEIVSDVDDWPNPAEDDFDED